MDRYEFIWESVQKHGYKYDYRKVNYINKSTKVYIICPEHGGFWQTPKCHINKKHGCPECGKIKANKSNQLRSIKASQEFVDKAKLVHDDKYDYSKVNYVNNHTKVCIICPEHGEFYQIPNSHLNGEGCSKCNIHKIGNNIRKTTNGYIEEAIQIHGDKYDYSKVNYIDKETKICIICPKHGEFWQSPNKHLYRQGCPKCKESKLESNMALLLTNHNIAYEQQKCFSWLGRQKLDFYLPDYNVAIECQGEQHFKPVEYWGGEEKLKHCKKLDSIKYDKCNLNNVKILYFAEKSNKIPSKYLSHIFTNENDLLNYIEKEL